MFCVTDDAGIQALAAKESLQELTINTPEPNRISSEAINALTGSRKWRGLDIVFVHSNPKGTGAEKAERIVLIREGVRQAVE